jgi:hypothetical protein
MLWLQTKDEHFLQEAKLDQKRASQTADVLSQSISSENLIALKKNIPNLIHDDANIRRDSLKVVTETRTEANAAASATSIRSLNKLWIYIILFVTGAAAWGIFPLIFLIIKAIGPSGESVIRVFSLMSGLVFFLLFILTLKGWDWFSQYKFGSYGSLIKYMSTLFIGFTVIGLIPVCYWTGKGIFRWIDKLGGRKFLPMNIVY